jgi:hypothetical protein
LNVSSRGTLDGMILSIGSPNAGQSNQPAIATILTFKKTTNYRWADKGIYGRIDLYQQPTHNTPYPEVPL